MTSSARVRALLALLREQPVGALGTLHKSEPFVSMVPFALLPTHGEFVIHVSRLASHTKDMIDCPATSLMIAGQLRHESSPRELPRATFQCHASRCAETDQTYPEARTAYLSRFPESAELFNFADFSLFTLQPRYARHVGGFAQAATIMQPELGNILAGYAQSAA